MKDFIPTSEITDNENLYRKFPGQPSFWNTVEGKVSSALFKDKRGVSVDREGDRPEEQIIDLFEHRYPGCGLVVITGDKCRECGTKPVPKPLPENIYHAEIRNDDGSPKIRPKSKLEALRNACEIVKFPTLSLSQ